ncbi:DHA2 family efflux MFS transporter permease subunit [Mesobacterium sp. TK19101]|uniref:DHA2 family efflux MFS transporter permease subunit n=1 Tax=Mesobacterium hydrothermale TaxID=3111907 RepID=A0ABU6HDV4_9RHOB|nr:DHA2 family efflux MFS transporter permease subunit [Mesobacterium sp. TK19101]
MPVAIVVAVVLSAILEVLDSTVVNVALPHIKSSFGATTDQTTWILTSYIVSAVVVMPLTGFMARRIGRKRLILSAITGFALFSMLCGLAWSLGSIVAFRMGQGMFGAFLIPLSQSILFDSFPKEKRGQAMAMFGLGVVVAPVMGPTIGAILTDAYSWRMVFFVNLPIAALALAMLTGELADSPTVKTRIDWAGLGLMALAIGALQYVLDQGQGKDWFASHVIQAAALISAVAGALFLWRAVTRQDNIVNLRMFGDANFAAGNAIIAGFAVAMFGAIAILPLFVQGLLGYPVIEAGYLFIPRGIAAGFSMVITGSVLVTRYDPRLLAVFGLGLTAASNFMMGGLNLNATFWQLAWPGVVGGLGMGLVFVPQSTLAFAGIDSSQQDEASGLYGVTRQLGSSIGIAVVGAMIVRGIATDTATLTGHVTAFSDTAYAMLNPLGLTPDTPEGAAVLAGQIAKQAAMMSYARTFNVLGWVAIALLPILLFMRKPATSGGAPIAH